MSLARLRSDPSIKIRAREYNRSKHGEVCCFKCRCTVEGVPSTTRTITEEGKQVFVDAYFRLPKNAEKKGKGHKANCRFNIERTVERFVAKSKEIKGFGKEEDLLLARTQGAKVELRLHIMMKAIRFAPWRSAIEFSNQDSKTAATGARYSSSGRTLSPYLKMAKAVLALITRVQERKYLANHIVLKYAEHTIPWNQYFFPFESYDELYRYLTKYAAKREDRPIAVVVRVGKMWDEQKNGDWAISCWVGTAKRQSATPGTPLYLRPMLYVKDRDLADRIARREFILVCALPRLSKIQQPTKTGRHPEVRLYLSVNHSEQVCGYTLIEDGNE